MGPRVQESQVAWTEVVAGRDERLIKKRWNLMKRASPKWKDRGINQIVRFCVGGAATWFISCVCCSSQAAFVAVSLHPCDTGCCCPAVAQAAARFHVLIRLWSLFRLWSQRLPDSPPPVCLQCRLCLPGGHPSNGMHLEHLTSSTTHHLHANGHRHGVSN